MAPFYVKNIFILCCARRAGNECLYKPGAPGTTKDEKQGNRLNKMNNRRKRKLF